MAKTIEGYVDDGRAAPLPNVSVVVTEVGVGTIITSGVTGADGHWYFDGLDESKEYFANIVDIDGNAIVRGPWSGEVRDVWVRDRLAIPDTAQAALPNGGQTTVGGLPLTLDPDAENILEWGVAGLFVPPVSASFDVWTKTESDARYEPIDTAYTKAETDARYEPFDSAYTKTEADARYTQGGITQAAADLRYEPLDTMYTKAEDDARFVNLAGGSVMTGLLGPTTNNTRDLGTSALRWKDLYLQGQLNFNDAITDPRIVFYNSPRFSIGIAAGQLRYDAGVASNAHRFYVAAVERFGLSDASAVLTVPLTVQSKPVAISPDGSNILEWRANGFYAAAGAVTDIWVNTTGDTMTGALNMTADILPTVTNVRSLGSTSLRWLKIWATDADFTNAPTVGGAALLTQTTADALFLTPAEGNAAYATTAHAHDAAYVNVTGDTMTGDLTLSATVARLIFNETDHTANSKNTRLWVDGGIFRIQAFDDAGNGGGVSLDITRVNNNWNTFSFNSHMSLGGTALYVDASQKLAWVNKLTDPALPATYAGQPGLLVQHEGAHLNGLSLARASSADTSPEILNFWRSRGTWASKVAIANADNLSQMTSWAWSGANWLASAAIQVGVTGTVTTTAVPTSMLFYTADSAGALATRMSIGANGRVGIGAASVVATPGAMIDVQALTSGDYTTIIRAHASHTNTIAFLRVVGAAGGLILGANNVGWVSDGTTDRGGISATTQVVNHTIGVYNGAGSLIGYLRLHGSPT